MFVLHFRFLEAKEGFFFFLVSNVKQSERLHLRKKTEGNARKRQVPIGLFHLTASLTCVRDPLSDSGRGHFHLSLRH